jgi:hypothetical protein
MSDTAENSDPITESRKGPVENLRPWPKGVSGNPGGRPKGIVGKACCLSFASAPKMGRQTSMP